jgi:hypothetical protein
MSGALRSLDDEMPLPLRIARLATGRVRPGGRDLDVDGGQQLTTAAWA